MVAFQATVGLPHSSQWTSCVIVDGIFVEHWDVLQDEATEAQSKNGLPMFGQNFPA
jgi:predicted SnoaL-like aldol condensation-catalyzing enzyme